MLARPEPEAPAAAAPADNSMLELIQGMLMQQSSSLAKFEKKMDDRTSNLESMSMQSAMNGAKQTSQTGASQQLHLPLFSFTAVGRALMPLGEHQAARSRRERAKHL